MGLTASTGCPVSGSGSGPLTICWVNDDDDDDDDDVVVVVVVIVIRVIGGGRGEAGGGRGGAREQPPLGWPKFSLQISHFESSSSSVPRLSISIRASDSMYSSNSTGKNR